MYFLVVLLLILLVIIIRYFIYIIINIIIIIILCPLASCFSKTGARPSGGSQEIFIGSFHIMFSRSLQRMTVDLSREVL